MAVFYHPYEHSMTMALYETDDLRCPPGGQLRTVITQDGMTLRAAFWHPPVQPKGTIVILHGRTEFIEKYYEVIRECLQRNMAVATFDWRGQGLSQRLLNDRRKGHIHNLKDYGLDLDAVMRQVVLPDCPAPITLLSHSTGGAVALLAAQKGRTRYDRVVLSSPLIQLDIDPFSHGQIADLAQLLVWMGLSECYVPGGSSELFGTQPFEDNVVTSHRGRYERAKAMLKQHPELGIAAPTVGWVHAACKGVQAFQDPDFLAGIKVPVLLLVGLNEKVVSVSAIEKLGRNLPSGKLIRIPGAAHEVMMEQDRYREMFWAALDGFLPV
jgi:lysophospholipase